LLSHAPQLPNTVFLGNHVMPALVGIKRLAYKLAVRVLQLYWFVFRPRTFGVTCIIRDADGRVLMVRHTYGKRAWSFPGGGTKRNETSEATVRREIREEVGIELADLQQVGSFLNNVEFKRDSVTVFTARPASAELNLRLEEIAEARWVDLNALPSPTAPVASRSLSLWLKRDLPEPIA
jgi:8-oxo-dGTP pyrophosphatase MutT (NUDIX family)